MYRFMLSHEQLNCIIFYPELAKEFSTATSDHFDNVIQDNISSIFNNATRFYSSLPSMVMQI